MTRDTLFLLTPSFVDPRLGRDAWYCVECAALEGLLVFTPGLAQRLEVHRIGFEKPRAELVALLGPEHQNCPMLVPHSDRAAGIPGAETSTATGRTFVTGLVPIGDYLARVYCIARPHP